MNKQEYQSAIIQAKQEALEWQEKYIAQRDINAKLTEKIIRQATVIAELQELYNGEQSRRNEKRVENLAKGLTMLLETQLASFGKIIDRRYNLAKDGKSITLFGSNFSPDDILDIYLVDRIRDISNYVVSAQLESLRRTDISLVSDPDWWKEVKND